MLASGKERLRGTFYYLEGWVGSVRWASPFVGLGIGMSRAADHQRSKLIYSRTAKNPSNAPSPPPVDLELQSSKPVGKVPKPVTTAAKRNRLARSTAMKTVTTSRRTPAATSKVTQTASVPSLPVESQAQPDRSPKLRFKIPPQDRVARKTILPERNPPSIRATSPTGVAEGETSSEVADCDTSGSESASETDEASSMSRRFNSLSDLHSNIDFNSHADLNLISDMDLSGDTSGDESSTGTYAAANANTVNRKVDSNPTIYLALSGDTKPAVFPDNPLGPVIWDARPDATRSRYLIDEASIAYPTSRDNEDDIVMQDSPEEAFGVYQPTRASSAARSTTSGSSWSQDRTAFREPPDLSHEDMDTPPTSPESFSDAADDDVSMADANDTIRIERVVDSDILTDDSLVDAVRTLRGLLTTEPKPLTESSTYFTVIDIQGSRKEPIRRLRFWSEEFTKISLAPPPCIPSPSSSPRSVSSFSVHSANSVAENPASPTVSKEDSNDRFSSSWYLPTGLQAQLTPAEIECQEICEFDVAAMEHGVLDEVKDVHRLLFDAVNNLSEAAILSGPESVDMEELDKVWSVNEGDASSLTSYRSAYHVDTKSTVGSETSCTVRSRRDKKPATETADPRRKRVAVQLDDCRATSSKADSESRLRMDIDEDDRIGIKEVDDAMLCSWVEEEDAFQEMADADFSERDDRNTSSRESDAPATPTAVDPNLLGIIKPLDIDIPRSLPTVPSLRNSRTDGAATWAAANQRPQGIKAIPPLAVRPRAMVHCQTVSRNQSDAPSTAPSAESSSAQPITAQSPINFRRDRASVTFEEKLRNVDNIPVYALPWGGVLLFRRIDSDYSELLRLGTARSRLTDSLALSQRQHALSIFEEA